MKPLAPTLGALTLTTLLVASGCGSTSTGAAPPAGTPTATTTAPRPSDGVLTPTPVPTPTTTSAAPTTSGPPRDATKDDLARARVPAVCDQPAMTLEKGAMPQRYAPARGRIEGPYTSADLDGDGAKEIAGLYRCRTDRGAARPPVVVVARSGGSTVGAVDLDRGRRRSTIDAITPARDSIALTWRAATGDDVLTFSSVLRVRDGRLVLDDAATPSPTPAPMPSTLPTPPTPTSDGPSVTGTTEFATPSGNTVCTLGPDGARCTAERTTFTPPPDPGCGSAWGRSTEVAGVAVAAMVCDPAAWAGAPTQPSWWQEGVDTRTTSLGRQGVYALGYGHVLTAGPVSCSVSEQAGVTCTKGAHGFTLSRDSYRVW